MKSSCFAFLAVVFLLAGCTFAPRLIEHPRPNLQITPLADPGIACEDTLSCPGILADWQYRDRATFEKPKDLLGGLDPALPIAKYWILNTKEDAQIPAVYSGSCAFWFYYGYIVNQGGKFVILDSAEKFRQTYAPIESENEALSYAVAMTGYVPMYNLETIESIDMQTSMLHETYVRKTSEGYLVHLFDWFLCNCGPFNINTVDVTVHKDGSLSIAEPQPGFRDPSMDINCMD